MSQVLVQVSASGLCQIATLAWFVYDYFLVLEDEVEHVWFRKFNITSVFYFLSRFLSFGMLMIGAVEATRQYPLTATQCEIFHWVEGIGTMLIFVNTQVVLQYRLWAMFNRSMKLLIVNGILFTVEAAAAIAVCSLSYATQTVVDVNTCSHQVERNMALIFLSVLIYELYLVGLAFYRTMKNRRLINISGQRSLTVVLAYDSVVYFALIVTSVFAVIVLWLVAPVQPGNAAICFTRAASGIGASRLILHMRKEVRLRDQMSYSSPDCVGVSLHFATSAADSPARLVPSGTRTDSSRGPSPKPSLLSLFSRRGSEGSSNSSLVSPRTTTRAIPHGHSPQGSLSTSEALSPTSTAYGQIRPLSAASSVPFRHTPRPSVTSIASSSSSPSHSPRPSVTAVDMPTLSLQGALALTLAPSNTDRSSDASSSQQRSPARDYYFTLPPA